MKKRPGLAHLKKDSVYGIVKLPHELVVPQPSQNSFFLKIVDQNTFQSSFTYL